MENGKNQIEPEPTETPETLGAKEYFEQYWRYCAAVRNWLVAFGIGCCVLLISEKAGIFKDVPTQKKVDIVFYLLVGVISQIVLALFNKYIHWCIYWGLEDENFRQGWCHKISIKMSRCFWIDILADVLTLSAFVIALCKMFRC